MNVRVKLLGPLRQAPRRGERPPHGVLDLTLPDGATLEDLLDRLAARFGAPFDDSLREDAELPPSVRVFVDGQLVVERHRPLARPGESSQKVIVDLMVPITGGR